MDISETDNNIRVSRASNGQIALFLFKDKHEDNDDKIYLSCDLQSTVAPSSNTVYLQIFNTHSGQGWETMGTELRRSLMRREELLGKQ